MEHRSVDLRPPRAAGTRTKGHFPPVVSGLWQRDGAGTYSKAGEALVGQASPVTGIVLDTFMAVLMTFTLRCFRNHETH